MADVLATRTGKYCSQIHLFMEFDVNDNVLLWFYSRVYWNSGLLRFWL